MEIKINITPEEAEQLSPQVRDALEALAESIAGPAEGSDEEVEGFKFTPGPTTRIPLGPGPIIGGPPILQFCVSFDDSGGGSCGVYVREDDDDPVAKSCSVQWR